MILKKQSFDLSKSWNFYFIKDKIFLILKYGFYFIKLPSLYLVSKKNKIFSFLFLSAYFFKSFMANFLYVYNKLFLFFYFKLRLRGLGFRVRRICSNLYKFFFTLTNYFYLHVPLNIICRVKGRRLFFLSNDFSILYSVLIDLSLLKKLIVYKLRGLLFPRKIIIMKPGKKR